MSFSKKTRIFIQVSSFIFLIFAIPLLCIASNLDKSSEAIKDDSQKQVKELFKKAIELSNAELYAEAEKILSEFTGDDLWKEKAYFLLGRLYKERGIFDKAEDYLKKAVISSPLLKDYALKFLTDVYIATEKFDKAIETARQIQNKVLLKDARKSEITALLKAKRDDEALELLYSYTKEYPNEWESKLTLARLLKKHDKTNEAISLFKKIYINVVPVSADALRELKEMKADTFTTEELIRRADNLFEKGNFQRAEETYREALEEQKSEVKSQKSEQGKTVDIDKIIFSIGMCQFKLKQYDKASKSFRLIKSPEAMYWEARAYNRIDDEDGFNSVIKKFQSEYPKDERLAKLFLISADNLRRTNKVNEVEGIFKRVLNEFPQMTEDALWGLGWMSYTAKDYETASKYFLKLTASVKGDKLYKYLYWHARSLQKLTENCVEIKTSNNTNNPCPEKDNDFFAKLPHNTGYYGYLIRLRPTPLEISVPKHRDKISIPARLRDKLPPAKPEGEAYERIETLVFLGMKDEAVNEINAIIQEVNKPEEFLYLGYMAMGIGEYKRIISMAEGIEKDEFLSFSYPLGYWDIVKKASEIANVDAYLVTAMIREESRFDPMAVSNAGAIGLMQIMPSTAQRLKNSVKANLKGISEIYDIEKNILIGTHYLSLLIKEFKEIPFALAAYNAGENALQKWLNQYKQKDIDEFIEDIPYVETKRYVKKVLRSYWQYRTMDGLPLYELPAEK